MNYEMIIGLTAIFVTITIPIVVFLIKKFYTIPYLTLEIKLRECQSSPIGFSNESILTSEGYIDGDEEIQFFEIECKLEFIIRNNSNNSAFFPKLYIINNSINLTEIDKINYNDPIKACDLKIIQYKYIYKEKKTIGKRSDLNEFPVQMENLEILLSYKNESNTNFYTLFKFLNKTNKGIKWKHPKI